MSYADKVFVEMCNDIINNGVDTKGEKVRPVWTDTGEKAYTIKKFGVVNRYDLSKEFPAVTHRKTAIKSATDEMLWIWQKKSNNIHDLNSHVWDEWADEEGSIGKAYGYQIGQKYVHHKIENENSEDLSSYPSVELEKREDGKYNVYLDQIDGVIYDLKNNPYSRRIMTNIYTFKDLNEMHLYPCAYSMTFNVTKKKDSDKLVLNGILNQRSQDVLAANNWNVCQYAVLLMMLAQVCDMQVGELVHVIADCHIYDRHVDVVKELITREQFDAPKVWITPDIKNFYEFTRDDVHIENYEAGPQVKNIPIAV
jgi:thymidylate synthase